MRNGDKIILDLCGGTGAWSEPYRKAGYDVRLVTLPETDVRTYEPPEGVHGILAAPPCTMFSQARRRAKKPRDFAEGMEVVRKCLEIIWKCREEGTLKWWALENPRGYLRQFLGKAPYEFQPWWFGDRHTKATELWGYFNEPKKKRGQTKPRSKKLDYLKSKNGLNRTQLRAQTPPGFARAFFKANS